MSDVEVYRREDGLYDWRLKDANHEILCGSMQGYTQISDAIEGFTNSQRAIRHPFMTILDRDDRSPTVKEAGDARESGEELEAVRDVAQERFQQVVSSPNRKLAEQQEEEIEQEAPE